MSHNSVKQRVSLHNMYHSHVRPGLWLSSRVLLLLHVVWTEMHLAEKIKNCYRINANLTNANLLLMHAVNPEVYRKLICISLKNVNLCNSEEMQFRVEIDLISSF